MTIQGMLSKGIQQELVSLIAYACITFFILAGLKTLGIISLTFNPVLMNVIVDWIVVAIVVIFSAFIVEYLEDALRIDIDKWTKTEQVTAVLLAVLFYPCMFAMGYFGAMIPIAFTFQLGLESILLGLLVTTGLFVIVGALATAIAVKYVK